MDDTAAPADTDRLLDLSQVRDRVPIGRSRLFDLIGTGQLRTVRIGRRRFVRASDLSAFVAGLTDGDAA